jgi:hypothetical protein
VLSLEPKARRRLGGHAFWRSRASTLKRRSPSKAPSWLRRCWLAPAANAAEATGKIKSLDMTKDMVTLDNGSSYVAPKNMKLSDFKIGEKVTVSYTKTGDKMDIGSMKPAS